MMAGFEFELMEVCCAAGNGEAKRERNGNVGGEKGGGGGRWLHKIQTKMHQVKKKVKKKTKINQSFKIQTNKMK
jgi:hypothetical protein